MDRREAIRKSALALGGILAAPTILGILNGCQADPELTFAPKFFSEEDAWLVADLAEVILPETDTPGAKAVGVPAYIDNMLAGYYGEKDQARFREGLEAFKAEVAETYKKPFYRLEPEAQLEITEKIHNEAVIAIRPPGEGAPFILMMKELTITGFYTSEIGATEVLTYATVPGAYLGCIPYDEVGKAWAF